MMIDRPILSWLAAAFVMAVVVAPAWAGRSDFRDWQEAMLETWFPPLPMDVEAEDVGIPYERAYQGHMYVQRLYRFADAMELTVTLGNVTPLQEAWQGYAAERQKKLEADVWQERPLQLRGKTLTILWNEYDQQAYLLHLMHAGEGDEQVLLEIKASTVIQWHALQDFLAKFQYSEVLAQTEKETYRHVVQ